MWIFIAVAGYSFLAFESVASKFLLAGRLKSWQLYTFYIGFFSVFSLILTPFGLQWRGTMPFTLSLFSGVIFYLSLVLLFQSLLTSSTTRVYILYGTVTTLGTLVLAKIFLRENASFQEILGIFFLIGGGILISFKFYRSRFFSNYQKTIAAGLLAALSLVILKYAYGEQNFVSGYIISRMGIFATALLSLTIPSFREVIVRNIRQRKKKENLFNLAGTVGAKTLAGIGTLLIHYSIFLGNVTVVNALVSTQYALIFIFSIIFSLYLKKIFVERLTWSNTLIKTVGIVLVAVGTALVTTM